MLLKNAFSCLLLAGGLLAQSTAKLDSDLAALSNPSGVGGGDRGTVYR